MNNSHYPSLELCKKLTEIGFPFTEKIYSRSVGRYLSGPKAGEGFEFQIRRNPLPGDITTDNCREEYLCPTVMEMIHVMPKNMRIDTSMSNWIEPKPFIEVSMFYKYKRLDTHTVNSDTLPNALAEMVIWLVENKYISFTK